MTLYNRYKRNKYAEGGGIGAVLGAGDPTMMAVQAVQQLGTGIVDAVDKPDEFSGVQSMAGSLIKGGLQGGPLGALMAGIANKKARQVGMRTFNQNQAASDLADKERSAALLATNPQLLEGNEKQGYFGNGGNLKAPLTRMFMTGGSAKQLSSDSVDLVGKGHEDGGIDIPGMGAEVEGKETAKGSFVFSDKLGFASEHRTIARAKGIIEKKPATQERVNSIKRLEAREQELMLTQEFLKSQM